MQISYKQQISEKFLRGSRDGVVQKYVKNTFFTGSKFNDDILKEGSKGCYWSRLKNEKCLQPSQPHILSD